MGPIRRVIPFTEPGRDDVGRLGGKNASSGELINRLGAVGIRVPPGFAATAEAYEELLGAHDLRGPVEARTDRLHEVARPDEVGAATRSRLCGRRPSDEPAFGSILVDAGLDSISVAPDSFAAVKRHVARAERTRDSGPGGGE